MLVPVERTLGHLESLAATERRCDAPREPDSEVDHELKKLGWQLEEREPVINRLLECWPSQWCGVAAVAALALWTTDALATGAAAPGPAPGQERLAIRERLVLLEL